MSGQIITGRRALPPPATRYSSPASRRVTRKSRGAYPALRPTTYADRATVAAMSASRRAESATPVVARPVAAAPVAATPAAATPVATTGGRVAMALTAIALVSFLLLVVALVVPSSMRLPLAGAGFVGLLAARVFGSQVRWPDPTRAMRATMGTATSG